MNITRCSITDEDMHVARKTPIERYRNIGITAPH